MAGLILSVAVLLAAMPCALAQYQQMATFFGGAPDGMDPSQPSFGLLEGSCGFGALTNKNAWPFWSTVGISQSSPFYSNPLKGCGTCLQLQCNPSSSAYPQLAGNCISSSPITVVVTDTCPQCDANHLDVSADAFAQIGNVASGNIPVTVTQVPCQPKQNIAVSVDKISGPGAWFRMYAQAVGQGGAVTAVSVSPSGANSWTPLTNLWGADWEGTLPSSLPIDIQLTQGGSTVVATSVLGTPGAGVYLTDAQFGAASSSASASASASSSIAASSSTAATTSATTSSASTTAAAAGACTDVSPDPTVSCAQQAAYGQCGQAWMFPGLPVPWNAAALPFGFCAVTCGHCGGASGR